MKLSIAICMALMPLFLSATNPPVEYLTTVRNSQGEAVADQRVSVSIDIVATPEATEALYSEIHDITTDDNGMIRILIGEGDAIGSTDYDDLTWDALRYVAVAVDFDRSGLYRPMGTMSLMGAPTAIHAVEANALQQRSPSGTLWNLAVDNSGNLHWEKVTENGGGGQQEEQPAYDKEKIPSRLFFIGNVLNWDIANAPEFTKTGDYTFAIDRQLTAGEIFKFTPSASWANDRDWSTEKMAVGTPVAMREMGNCPEFIGPDGLYTIVIDFFHYTMTINPK